MSNRVAFNRPYTTAACVVWLVCIALVYLAPALAHGTSLGPYDVLGHFGLGEPVGAIYNVGATDQIQQMAPWTALDWLEVHSGHLPLWNPYSLLGMPLAFNFQSAPFSLPTIVAYLAPLKYAYTSAILMKMILAGTGVLYLGRKLSLSNLSSVFAGTVFELSGAFTGWLGWPQATVMCLGGWVLGASVAILDRKDTQSRATSVAFLGILGACAIYGGHPESLIFLAMCVVFVSIAYLVPRQSPSPKGAGRLNRQLSAIVDLGLAAIASCALAAPLLIPGLPILSASARQVSQSFGGLPPVYAINLFSSGYFGYPLSGSSMLALHGGVDYYEAASYVGVVALVLALFSILCFRRKPAVMAFGGIAAVFLAILFIPPISRFLSSMPGLKVVIWTRASLPLDLALAVLAGIGFEILRAKGLSSWYLKRLGLAGLLIALGVFVLWIRYRPRTSHPSAAANAEMHAFLLPVVGICVVGAVLAGLVMLHRRSPSPTKWLHRVRPFGATLACAVLFVAEVAFLLTATPNLWSSSSEFFAQSPAEVTLKNTVGSSRVGFELCDTLITFPADIGILPDDNAAYGLSELAVYDPALPQKYYTDWSRLTGQPLVSTGLGNFCPSLSSAQLARHFGVAYVLAPSGSQPQSGLVFDRKIGNEVLYAVPGGGIATLARRSEPQDDSSAHVLAVSSPSPRTMEIRTKANYASTLYIHVADYEGWHLSVDGRAQPLRSWAGLMMDVELPPGPHVVQLTYLPRGFVLGLVLAGTAVIALVLWVIIERRFRRGRAAVAAEALP